MLTVTDVCMFLSFFLSLMQGFGSVLLRVLPPVCVHRPGRVSHGVCWTHMDADCT